MPGADIVTVVTGPSNPELGTINIDEARERLASARWIGEKMRKGDVLICFDKKQDALGDLMASRLRRLTNSLKAAKRSGSFRRKRALDAGHQPCGGAMRCPAAHRRKPPWFALRAPCGPDVARGEFTTVSFGRARCLEALACISLRSRIP
jgi:hypothetical protein